MYLDQFDQQIKDFGWRVGTLLQDAGEPFQPRQLLPQTLEELRAAVEELQVAQEELRQQNDELTASRQLLEAERQRYQELFELAPDGYLVTDADGTIQEANCAIARLLNVSQQFLVNKPLVLFVAQSERLAFHTKLTQLDKENRVQEWEFCLQPRYSSASFDAALTVASVRDRQGKVVVRICVRDISERKRAKQVLQESEERFRLLVEGVKDYAIFMLDTCGRVVSWNSGAERIVGYQESEIIGQHVSCLFTPEDIQSDRPEQELRTAVAEGQVEEEHWLVRQDGIRFWSSGVLTALRDEVGELRGFSKILRDKTSVKQAELEREQLLQQLEAERGRLDAVVQQMPAGLIIANAASGKITFCNTQAYHLWGDVMPHDNINPYYKYKGFHPDGRPYNFEEWPIVRTLSIGEVVKDEEINMVRQDSMACTMCFSSAPIHDRQGQVVAGVMTFYDITERKQLEAALRQHAEELGQANRMKDEFLAILSHELRTPLNAVLGWAQILRTRKLDEAKTERALEAIERNAKLQFQLIQDLLQISRIIQGNICLDIRPVKLVPTIEAAINTVCLAADAKNIQIKSMHKPTVCLVAGDANRLQQVFWHLLSNAVKFTPVGGQVEVKLDCTDSQAEITVSDTGKGIKAEFLPYVFVREACALRNRFRQFDSSLTRSYGGLGIGLALVRYLVEMHGGSVYAESRGEGQGATFIIKLPLTKATRTSH